MYEKNIKATNKKLEKVSVKEIADALNATIIKKTNIKHWFKTFLMRNKIGKTMSKYYVVIDTDTYAGNFERQMCAYITGVIGECGAGQEPAQVAQQELTTEQFGWFNLQVEQEPDEHGCCRPVKIYPTPGYFNNGLGFEYQAGEEDKAIEAYRKHWLKEAKEDPYYNPTDADKEEHRKEYEEKAANAENEYGHYESYQSVAIGFCVKPNAEMLELIKQRANAYQQLCNKNTDYDYNTEFNIIGIRLVEEKTTTNSIDI